jgi:bacteriocin biosynthesis cyclodehydratase domain-containing protein
VDDRLVIQTSTGHPEPVTLRPTIRPGAPLLRRDATHLQVGTSPGTVIDDRPGLRSFLRLLNGARDVEQLRRLVRSEVPELEGDVDDVLKPLLACGAVVDASRLHVRRPRLRVALHDDAGGRPLTRAIGHALADLGIATLDAPDPDLLLVVSSGEPPRAVFDQARRHRVSHLPVVIDEDRVRIGPAVIPGLTPCLTCLDLHRTDWDRAWPALLPQLGRSRSPLPPVLPVPLRYAAAAEVTIEVQAVAAGSRPRTAGQVLALGPAHDARVAWPVAFHHGCACALLPAA